MMLALGSDAADIQRRCNILVFNPSFAASGNAAPNQAQFCQNPTANG